MIITRIDTVPILVTSTDNKEANIVKNQIGNAIVKRIIRAHEEQEKFKVFVLMPLMPAFPADLSTKDAATAR
jgi:phospholipase D1/2